MKSLLIVIKLGLVLTAVCAVSFALSSRPSGEEPRVDPRIKPYFDEWKRDLNSAGLDYSVALGRVERITVCSGCRAGYSDRVEGTIAISEDQLGFGPNSVRGTLYHELGHAVFNLQHGSCKIMRSRSWTEEELEHNWPLFVKEYLEACKKNEYEARF